MSQDERADGITWECRKEMVKKLVRKKEWILPIGIQLMNESVTLTDH